MKTPECPPFPTLTWGGYFWEGEALFASWKGYRPRRRAIAAPDGTVTVSVKVADSDAPTPPSAEQIAAYRHLVEQEKVIGDAILQAVFARYPEEREAFLDSMDEEAHDDCPEITSLAQLRPLIGLRSLHVLREAKDGFAYLGFEFACAWDSEHGLGVMMHLDRCVSIGGADHSFLEWIADRDIRAEK